MNNYEQGHFVTHNQLKYAYNINTSFLTNPQIHSSIRNME